MAQIQVLSQSVADKIAAGEVAERPAAVVKELVENAIDAGADDICVEIRHGGIEYIGVTDNGKGIAADELETAFLRHATSKLRSVDDLFRISTMGFRGEALASICAVSSVEVVSRTEDAEEGAYMELEHGVPSKKEEVACNRGTSMVVKNLFANVPARMKFLRKDSTEAGYVTDLMGRIAMSRPDIAFRYICDGKEVFSTSGDGRLKNAILNIYGIEFAKSIYDVDYEEHGVHVFGAAGKSETARGNRTRQTLFVNGRYIKNHVIAKVVEEAYRNVLMVGRFPFFVLNIELSPELVDVNVHPAKTEIKFANEQEIYSIVNRAVKNAIYNAGRIKAPTAQTESDSAAAANTENTAHLAAENKESVAAGSDPRGMTGVEDAYREKLKQSAGTNRTDASLIMEYIDQIEKEEGRPRMISFNEPRGEDEDALEIAKKIQAERGGEKVDVFAENPQQQGGENTAAAENGGGNIAAEDAGLTDATAAENAASGAAETSDCISGADGQVFAITDEKKEIRVAGQVFDTYVIAECGDEMYLIDQHAAHERRRFEMLKVNYAKREISGQLLLAPIVFDADPTERQTLLDNAEQLKALGIGIENFGRNALLITETPIIADDEVIKGMVTELAEILHDGRPSGLLSFEERLLDTISCKYAIKANKRLSMFEMESLVKDVEELEEKGITTCPHGRPIKVLFTKHELEKLFKRIV